MLSSRQEKSKRRRKSQPSRTRSSGSNTDPSVDRSNSNNSTNHYHQHFHHHHYHTDLPSRTNSQASSSSSFSNRPAGYNNQAAIHLQHEPSRHKSTKSHTSRVSSGSHYSQPTLQSIQRNPTTASRYQQDALLDRQGTVILHPRNASSSRKSIHEPKQQLQSHQTMQRALSQSSKARRTRDLPAIPTATRVVRAPTRKANASNNKVPRRPVHTVASLEALNKLEFGSPTLMIRRKQSIASMRGSPIRRFFLRIFRRRSRAKFYYTKAQLRKNLSLRLPDSNGRFKQYKIKSVQLMGLRPFPRTQSISRNPVRGQISQPLTVTKHTGIDNTGHGELLSIRSRRSSSLIRVKIPPDSPINRAARGSNMVKAPPLASGSSSLSNGEYDVIDERLDRLQQELDDTRRMKRRMSSRKGSLSSNGSLHGRSSRYSLNHAKSFISLTSSVLPTLNDHPDIIRRADLFKRKSLKYGLGYMVIPPSTNRVSQMDMDSANEPAKVEEALAFVNTWSEYLRRAIAVRILLRQQIRSVEIQEEMEWQQLHAVEEEEDAVSYTGETETVSSFGTGTSRSQDSQYLPKTSVSTAVPSNIVGSKLTGASQGDRTNSRGVPSSPSTGGTSRARAAFLQPELHSSRNNSLYSTADENVQGRDAYYYDNGDLVSITPISTSNRQSYTLPTVPTSADMDNKTHKRTASSIRRALRQGQMNERYSALMGSGSTQGKSMEKDTDLKALPLEKQLDQENEKISRNSSQNSGTSSKDSFGSFSKPGKESVWMRSSSSSGSSSHQSRSRPLPPIPGGTGLRVVSEPSKLSTRLSQNSSNSDFLPSPQHSTSSSPSQGDGSDSNSPSPEQQPARGSRTAGIPRLLQQQRNMSDRILADMVQEMEEMQARSLVLSGMVKTHREDEDEDQDVRTSSYHASTVSDKSSEYSVSPVHMKQMPLPPVDKRPLNYYVLDSQQQSATTARDAAGLKSSSSSSGYASNSAMVTPLPSLITNKNMHLAGVPKLPTGADSPRSIGSNDSLKLLKQQQDEQYGLIPRKISRAESIAASATVNLTRGKPNRRRRPRSATGSGSEYSSDTNSAVSSIGGDRYKETFVDLSAPQGVAAGSSPRGSTESDQRLTTSWVSMDLSRNH